MRLGKIQKWLLILLLVLLPTQLGVHFWPDWTMISGVRVDYFSPTFYFTDILILLMIVLEIFNFQFGFALLRNSIFNKFSNFKFQILNWRGSVALLGGLLFAVFVYLNISDSLSPAVSLYKWIKVLEFGLLGWIVAKNYKLLMSNYKFLLIPVFYESVLAIGQFWAQSSIGGLWYFLGERTFNSSTPGIANAYINGALVLRPYGTFSHPNVLGGFLAVVLPLLLARFLHNSRKINATRQWLVSCGWLLVIGFGYVALLLSLSRGAIVVGVGASLVVALPYLPRIFNFQFSIFNEFSSHKILKLSFLLILTTIVFLAFIPRLESLSIEPEPIVVREQLNSLAVANWVQSPIVGTGLGSSPLYSQRQDPSTRPRSLRIENNALQFQPTHNIYFLVLAETGLVGLVLLLGVLFIAVKKLWKGKNYVLLTSVLSIMVLGLFDHYFLTLQQGQLILVLIIALAFARDPSTSLRTDDI